MAERYIIRPESENFGSSKALPEKHYDTRQEEQPTGSGLLNTSDEIREQKPGVKKPEFKYIPIEESSQHWKDYFANFTPEEREKDLKRLDEKWEKLTRIPREVMYAKLRAWIRNRQIEEAEKQAFIHEGDPRYDPLTGELLKPDEHPLSPTRSYLIIGKTRARSFLPPNSSRLAQARLVDMDCEQEVEGESNERLIQRLRKAGFIEVEPAPADQDFFDYCKLTRYFTPDIIMQKFAALYQHAEWDMPDEERAEIENVRSLIYKWMINIMYSSVPEEEKKHLISTVYKLYWPLPNNNGLISE